jgi:hypothetical protein
VLMHDTNGGRRRTGDGAQQEGRTTDEPRNMELEVDSALASGAQVRRQPRRLDHCGDGVKLMQTRTRPKGRNTGDGVVQTGWTAQR